MKRKIVCGIALCLALSAVGCGKSQEQQAADYYQNELGLSEDEANDLAHELYGGDNESDTVEEEGPIVIEPLPELLNSEWYEGKVQVYDMVFSNDLSMTIDDIRRIVEASKYDVEIKEDFDGSGNVIIRYIVVNGKQFKFNQWQFDKEYEDLVKIGLLEDGYYYTIDTNVRDANEICFDKVIMDFEELGTRDAVISYLDANGFASVEADNSPYRVIGTKYLYLSYLSEDQAEYVDTPYYIANGVQSVKVYMVMVESELPGEVAYNGRTYSGAHMNLLECVGVNFNPDGTIQTIYHDGTIWRCLIMGEEL